MWLIVPYALTVPYFIVYIGFALFNYVLFDFGLSSFVVLNYDFDLAYPSQPTNQAVNNQGWWTLMMQPQMFSPMGAQGPYRYRCWGAMVHVMHLWWVYLGKPTSRPTNQSCVQARWPGANDECVVWRRPGLGQFCKGGSEQISQQILGLKTSVGVR